METLQEEKPLEAPSEGQLEGQPPAEEPVNWKRFALDIIETLLLAGVLFLIIHSISARVRVDGSSMHPTLENNEFVLVSKLDYKFGAIERGDIIVFDHPQDPKTQLIKRVIGLPGDHVVVQGGTVTVNGQALDEPYIASAPVYVGEWVVPENQLFVLGDNRNASSDSHQWSYLPLENVVGKAVLIYWPPQMWDVIQHEELLATQTE